MHEQQEKYHTLLRDPLTSFIGCSNMFENELLAIFVSLLTMQVLQALKVTGGSWASLEFEDTQGHLERRGDQVL